MATIDIIDILLILMNGMALGSFINSFIRTGNGAYVAMMLIPLVTIIIMILMIIPKTEPTPALTQGNFAHRVKTT